MPESEFWNMTERRFCAIMIGDNVNNGQAVDWDDPESVAAIEEE